MLFFRRNCSHPGQTPRPRLALLFLATLSELMFSQSALASNIAVASPINGTRVSSSIWVRAHNVGRAVFVRMLSAIPSTIAAQFAGAWLMLASEKARRLAVLLLTIALLMPCPRGSAQSTLVTSPISGQTSASPVSLRAHNTGCYGLKPTSFGYSIDNRTALVLSATAYDINTSDNSITAGVHTIHFKSWNNKGICPVVDTRFTVVPAAPTVTITASSASIIAGNSSTLTVAGTNATQVTVSGTDGSAYTLQGRGGTQAVKPTTTTTYTATATGAGGKASATTTITVVPAAPTVTVTATSASIVAGNSSTLTVAGTNATQVTVSGSDGSAYTLQISGGTQPVKPTTTTTYTATATGVGGKASATTTITVVPAAPTVTITATSASIVAGNSSTLTVAGTNATQVTVSGSDGSAYTLQISGGTQPIKPTTTTTYTATATGAGGKASATTTITVVPAAPTVTVTASSASIIAGNSSTLTVAGTNATQVTVSGTDGSAYTLQASGGTQAVKPTTTTTYTATATGVGGKASATTTITVVPAAVHGIPVEAISSGVLDGSSRWLWNYDPGTPGSAVGSSSYPISGLSLDNMAREFSAAYSQHGGEIYHLSFARDTTATHFIYDTNLYMVDPTQIANVEMDMNQVMADGRTVIFGTQCSSYSKTWEFTTRSSNGRDQWNASNLPCNPKTWPANTWHHVQIASHRDDNGIVTYDWVSVDGTYSDFQNATGDSASDLGWGAGSLLLNFQLDGASTGSGMMTAYMNKLIIYRW